MTASKLRDILKRFGQEHLLAFESQLGADERDCLHRQIASLDFERLSQLFEESKQPAASLRPEAVSPIPVCPLPKSDEDRSRRRQAFDRGLSALREGRVAAVLVAGGQGSRLGFEHPKGMYGIGPVRNTSLFQIHAEKILAWSRRVGRPIHWFIMTSPSNREETETFFQENRFFGLDPQTVHFFQQGTMPAVDAATGKVLLSEPGKLFSSPNGHGGSLTAMRECGVLEKMAEFGADLVYYFQVDNVKLKILDPAFLGLHLETDAELTTKVIKKNHPDEKVGLVVLYDGKPSIIEYSDLPSELAHQRTSDGELLLWPGSIAIHVFRREFLERITSAELGLPFHFAHKKVPYVDEAGELVEPSEPNAVKFEMFVFDAMPMAKKVTVVETAREEEYEPVKNASGDHSPETVRRAMTLQAAQWLRQAGVEFPHDDEGNPTVPLEISPLAGLDADDFARRLISRKPVAGVQYFSESDVRPIE